jgi:hypothetical protein
VTTAGCFDRAIATAFLRWNEFAFPLKPLSELHLNMKVLTDEHRCVACGCAEVRLVSGNQLAADYQLRGRVHRPSGSG